MCFGKNRLALDEDGSQESRTGNAMGALLSNHREAIAAMDFFTMPTLAFDILCCFFVIAHDRRRVVHFNKTTQPALG